MKLLLSVLVSAATATENADECAPANEKVRVANTREWIKMLLIGSTYV